MKNSHDNNNSRKTIEFEEHIISNDQNGPHETSSMEIDINDILNNDGLNLTKKDINILQINKN